MSDDDDKKFLGIKIPKRALDSRGAYVSFLVGTTLGVAADIASTGISLGQGTAGGGAAGLAAYEGYKLATIRRKLKKRCEQYIRYFSEKQDTKREAAMRALLDEIKIVKELSSEEIEAKIGKIVNDE